MITAAQATVRAIDVFFSHPRGLHVCSHSVAAGHLPHGMSVVLCAPAAVASLASLHPHRHADVAAALGCSDISSNHTNVAATLKSKLVQLMRSTGMPSGEI